MKKTALTGLIALGLAEISAATPVEAQGVTNPFVGPYVGVHSGSFDADATFTSAPYTATGLGETFPIPGRNESFAVDEIIWGAHGGINFLLGPNFIGGMEVDWTRLDESAATDFSGTGLTGGSDGFSFQSRSVLDFEWQGTIRGRLGFVAGNALFFATAGLAVLQLNWSESGTIQEAFGPAGTSAHSNSDTLFGTVVGGGAEIAISPTVILGADYLYEDFDSFDSVPHGFLTAQTGKIDDIEIHKVRVRVSVRFGGAPP